ncbi:polymer-forming cytoskeletal protein [Flavobacterium zepuense]|uniref:Polymer-forming cytoskeletal protein n=1 Tax=Flavobacterium zepuense TaxID=2593302 RepID=A0A552US64_9FLAO|nr:polymer-forming cytoskeletal protein [Flavobacterium zepuense]TRW21073.1 polymer-forming cytoskeletal protein [Flavobacterium zepuense]
MKINWQHKLRSGALQFTVFISVVIALVLAGALLLAYTHRFFLEQSKAIITTIQLADTGISALLVEKTATPDTILLNVPDVPDSQKVITHLSHWGIFEKAFVKATQGNKEFVKCCLIGSSMTAESRPALYLQETFKPLAVVGATHIEGNAYLPEQGLTTGSIAGHSYYGSEMIFGVVKKSTDSLPKLKYDYKAEINYYLKEFVPVADKGFIPVRPNSNVINSFRDPVKGYVSEGPIVLADITLIGNIVIRSAQKITIRRTALLKDIIISAPVIIIEDGVDGNFQAIASETIKVGKNCQLQYPSALILSYDGVQTGDANDLFSNKIAVDSGSTVRGSVCYFGSLADSNFKANVYISSDVTIKGEIYCQGNLELRGKVKGTVYTNQFITNEGGTVYVNHLYCATITNKELPENFGGILFENQTKSVMKWLY